MKATLNPRLTFGDFVLFPGDQLTRAKALIEAMYWQEESASAIKCALEADGFIVLKKQSDHEK